MKLYTFTIPVSWMLCSEVTIQATSLEEAHAIADGSPLPDDGQYIDGSWEVNIDCMDELNKGVLEMMKVDKTPIKDLPLLVGTLKTDQGKKRFEQRLKKGE